MDANKLQQFIWQGIRKEVLPEQIKLYIPFCFGNANDAPLCLTWDRNGVLNDGGRTMTELKQRVPDVRPYMDLIKDILSRCGDCKLVGGRMIVKEQFQTVIAGQDQYQDYLGGMQQMLRAISCISVIDTLTSCNGKEVLK